MPRPNFLPYEDRTGRSGVARYRIGDNFILIEFKNGGAYRYDFTTPGRKHVKAMQKLAASGDGLATYINQHVRENYAEQLW